MLYFRKQTISTRLSLYVILFGGLIFLATLLLLYFIGRDYVMQEAHRRGQKVFQTIELSANHFAHDIEHSVGDLSWFIHRCDSPEQIVELLRREVSDDPTIEGMVVAFEPSLMDRKGVHVTPYVYRTIDSIVVEMTSLEEIYKDADWYALPREKGCSVWSTLDVTQGRGEQHIACYSVPLDSEQGEFLGVCAVYVSIDWIKNTMKSLKPFPGAEIVMKTNDGYTFYSPLSDDGIDRTVGRDTVVFEQKINGGYWEIALICPKDEIFEALNRLNLLLALAVAVSLGLLYLAVRFVVKRTLEPLTRFGAVAETIATGNFDAPLPEFKYRDELYALGESIRFMQGALKKYMRRLRETTVRKERIENELKIAAGIQRAILTDRFPGCSRMGVYAMLRPAREVGGDLFDVIRHDGKVWFIVGDVSGKGVPAALYMGIVVFIFRTMVRRGTPLPEILHTLNDMLSEHNPTSMFVTLLAGVVDADSGKLELCNAGHDLPLLKTGAVTEVLRPDPNIALGVAENIDFTTSEYAFGPGSVLLVYTDGVTESKDAQKREFTLERLSTIVARSRNHCPELLVDEIVAAVDGHSAGCEQSDDLTLLAVSHYQAAEPLELRVESVELLPPFLARLGLSPESERELRLALEEVVVNAIDYSGSCEPLCLSASRNETEVVITLEDRGVAFDPLSVPEADTQSEIGDRPIGGLGVFLARKFTDDLYYRRIGGKNILTLVKRL